MFGLGFSVDGVKFVFLKCLKSSWWACLGGWEGRMWLGWTGAGRAENNCSMSIVTIKGSLLQFKVF